MINSIIKRIAKYFLSKELQLLNSSLKDSQMEADRCIASMEASQKYAKIMEEKAYQLEYRNDELERVLANPTRVIRLSRNVFTSFARSFPQPVVTGSTTDLQAAALVGQLAVLNKLEQELVID